MQLKFEGNSSIDANTLIGILAHYQSVANLTNMTYGGGAMKIHINVNAIEKGSFIVDLSVAETAGQLLHTAVTYLKELSETILAVYGAYHLFKGRPIKTKVDREKAEKEIMKNVETEINVEAAINTYNQPIVREAISKSIERADEDPSVESFTIADEHRETTFIRADFKDYIYDDFDNEGDIPNERTMEVDATLTIIGLKFENNSRWQFIYNGFKISMIVRDSVLMKKIDEGERFGKGDAIRVKMRILQKYNTDYKTYENVSYKIVEFKEHVIPRPHPEIFES